MPISGDTEGDRWKKPNGTGSLTNSGFRWNIAKNCRWTRETVKGLDAYRGNFDDIFRNGGGEEPKACRQCGVVPAVETKKRPYAGVEYCVFCAACGGLPVVELTRAGAVREWNNGRG